MFNKHPKRSGIYHIKDSIEKLELRVHLRQVNTLLKLPALVDWGKRHPSAGHVPHDEQPQAEELADSVTVKWQQKLLSPQEADLYRVAANCASETQQRYHKWLNKGRGSSSGGAEEGQLEEPPRRASKKRAGKRAHKSAAAAENNATTLGNMIFTYTHKDNFQPDEQCRERRDRPVPSQLPPTETMYIYATLQPDTQLVALTWYEERRLLHIYPDFNSLPDNPYFIEIDTDYRHLYAYAVEDVSGKRALNVAAENANFVQLPELPPQAEPSATALPHWQLERALTTQFAMPPLRMKRVALLLELHEAAHFEYDNLHVRYHIQLPPDTILEEGLLHASTHTSGAPAGRRGAHSIGYTWQLTLLCEEQYSPSAMLHIFFEVISLDAWERERLEGYAHYGTYLEPGADVVRMDCLRPVEGFMDALRRYFVGGRRRFDFMHFFIGPTTGESGQFHCRYGCRMQRTGQLELRCQRFTQRNCELLQPCSSTAGMTLDDIMMAYREARKRLETLAVK